MICINDKQVPARMVGVQNTEIEIVSTTGLKQFDETVHLTNTWLKEIMECLRWSERGLAYKALRSVLHTTRDRLPVALSAHLSAQLPMLVRGIYYEGWQPASEQSPERSLVSFLKPVERAFERYPGIRADIVAAAVFSVMRQHISHGEMENVVQALPRPVRDILTKPFAIAPTPGL